MDVSGLCFTDEFRMRPLIVWLCFGIVVLCALNVESQINYDIAHGQMGPIFRSIVPIVGYTNIGIGPQFVGRGQERQEEDQYDQDDDEEGKEDEPAYADDDESSNIAYEEEYEGDDDEEEGDDDSDNEEFGESPNVEVNNEVDGRLAYINNHYIEDSYVQIQRPQYNRFPVRNRKKPSTGQKKKPSPSLADIKPQSVLPINKKEEESIITFPESAVNVSPISALQTSNPNQKLELRPVATSTQFIATPVADLILRLSISLAKPVAQGNNTNFNAPLRIYEGALKKIEDSKVLRADVALSRNDNILTVTVPSVDKHALEDDTDVDEADEKEQTAEVPVTELRK